MKIDPLKLLRPNIVRLSPYSSARDEYKGKEGVFLDANENPFPGEYNRYPDPYQWEVKNELARIKKVSSEQLLIGNGSDEVIDLIFRAFCVPGKDNVILLPPTYGMYKVSAAINDVEVREVLLDENFQPDTDQILSQCDANTKLLFICSPNNPSGNCIDSNSIRNLLDRFPGVLVVDEAYIDFCPERSCVAQLEHYPNLIVMQTLSKAWGQAGLRMGIMLASAELIAVMNKIKPPYNINSCSQKMAMLVLKQRDEVLQKTKELIAERYLLVKALEQIPCVEKVFPSDANFLLVRMKNAKSVFDELIRNKIIVRDRSSIVRCENALRISVGTPDENKALVQTLKSICSIRM